MSALSDMPGASGAQIANGPGPANGTPNNLDDIYTPGGAPALQGCAPERTWLSLFVILCSGT